MECLVSKYGQMVHGAHFGRNFWEIIKNKDFDLEIPEKRSNFQAFFYMYANDALPCHRG